MNLARRFWLSAAFCATTVVAQEPLPTPIPAPASRPVELPTPVAPPSDPVTPPIATSATNSSAPRPPRVLVTRTKWPGSATFDPTFAPGFSTLPGPLTTTGEAPIPDEAVTTAARKLAALLDGARLESEVVEATGVSRRVVGGVVRSLLRARVTASRSGLTTVLNAPEAGVEITVKDSGPAKVRKLTPEECEEIVRRTEVSVDNAASSLPPAARGAFRDWWESKLKAIGAASGVLKSALEKSPEAAAPARAWASGSRSREAAPRQPRNRASKTLGSDRIARIDRVDEPAPGVGSAPSAVAIEPIEPNDPADPAQPPSPPSPPSTFEVVEVPGAEQPRASGDRNGRRLPNARLYEALVRRRTETPDNPVDPRDLFVEYGLEPESAADLERSIYVDDLARARSDALLGPDRSARLNQALDKARVRALYPEGVEFGRDGAAFDGFDRAFVFTDSRPGVDDYRRAVELEVRSAAEQARKMADEMRAEAARRNVEIERSMRDEFENARAAEQEALREHRAALEEFRRAREAQVQSLRTELDQLRKELDALRTERAQPVEDAPKKEPTPKPKQEPVPASGGGG